MKHLERVYVTAKQFQRKQLQTGEKFTQKVHKIEILFRHFTRAMTH